MLEYAALTSSDPADLARQMTERSSQGWEILQIVTSGTNITAFARRAAVAAQVANLGATPAVVSGPGTSATWSSTTTNSSVSTPVVSSPVVSSPMNTSVASSVGDAAAPANWYADPAGRFEMRYWNGSAWTEHVSRNGQQFVDPPVA